MSGHRISRRGFLAATATAGAGVMVAGQAAADPVITPAQTEGSFYPSRDQADKDGDLTRIEGRDGVALGEVVEIEGQVLDASGAPIESAVVDVWQANAAGRYAHERDPNPAPLDPNFQGWAVMTTGADGGYRFRTVKPGAYPVAGDWSRPPHIHFKVSRRGFKEVTTQMYFQDEPLNDLDRILNAVPDAERGALVARLEGGVYRFVVVLEAV